MVCGTGSFLFIPIRIRAVRYDDIYRIDEIKSLSFHIMFYSLFCGVAKYIVYGKTFSSFSVTAIFIHRPPWEVKGRQKQVENDQPGHKQELVPKRGTTSGHAFKHCSFKTTDFKPLKQQTYGCAISFCVRAACFSF